MAIPFLQEIKDLINEHGSATILRERLLFAAEQYAALELALSDAKIKIISLEGKILKLEEANSALSIKLKDSEFEVSRLQAKNEECEKEGNALKEKLSESNRVYRNRPAPDWRA